MLGTIKLERQIICEDVPIWIRQDETNFNTANAANAANATMGGIDMAFIDETAASHIASAYSIQVICRLQLDDGRAGNIIFTTSVGEFNILDVIGNKDLPR